MAERILIKLGNISPVQSTLPRAITSYFLPSEITANEAVKTVADSYAGYHSNDDPEWVDGEDEQIVRSLADFYGCEIGQPESWSTDEN